MSNGEAGGRTISEDDYNELFEAVNQVAEESEELDKGVKALKELVKKCCPHRATEIKDVA